jgi:hypothetical protein
MLFFLVGTGRCGTTLLARVLNTHPELFVINESHWIPKMYDVFGAARGPADELAEIVRRTWHVTGKPVFTGSAEQLTRAATDPPLTSVREFCDALMGELAAADGKRTWADKTPDYGPYMSLLQTLWPDARFVNLIRNGAAVARSMAAHPGYRWMATANETWWPAASYNRYYERIEATDQPLSAFEDLWARRFQRIRDESSRLKDDTYAELRFEDLVADPAAFIATFCEFVGLPYERSWLPRAAELVDANRPRERQPGWSASAMSGAPAALMDELGYSSDALEGRLP